MKRLLSYLFVTVMLLLVACENDPFSQGVGYDFKLSADTVSFDTVFTSINSVTLHFKIYNNSSKDLEIDEISLAGGDGSSFRINIDGVPANRLTDVVILGGDSMFIFVEADLDINNTSNLLVISDSVIIRNKRNEKRVKLLAYGQDVVHLRAQGDQDYIFIDEAKTIRAIYLEDITFTNNKPYLVHDHIYVDSSSTLTLDPGVTLYMRSGKSILVGGSLKVNGSLDEPVMIRGDRLDEVYEGLPYDKIDGQWGYVYLLAGSHHNDINFVQIRNSEYGIIADTVVTKNVPTLNIRNSVIQNVSNVALLGRGASITASNCVFANCGEQVVAFVLGGNYELTHCTIGNYYNSFFKARKEPALLLNNFYIDADKQVRPRALEKAVFKNCIIYGDNSSSYEVELNNAIEDEVVASDFNYVFDHCLIKGGSKMDTLDLEHFKSVVWDKSPAFMSPKQNADFNLDSLSAGINNGDAGFAASFPMDLFGVDRLSDLAPDLGAIEFVPNLSK